MAMIQLTMLGSFQVTRGGTPITHFRSDKVRALLAYLTVEAHRPHARASLCGLFWPDQPDVAALHNLSQTVLRLREALGATDIPFLHVTRGTIQWNHDSDYWLDVAEFTRMAASANIEDLERAVVLYNGEFLAGFTLSGCTAFEEWLLLTREHLAHQALTTLTTLADTQLAAGRYDSAEHYARRQVAIDPWREPAYRQLMRALVGRGDRAGALATYIRCRQALSDGLDTEPDAETQALYHAIRNGQGPESSVVRAQPSVPELSTHAAARTPQHALLTTDETLPAGLPALVGRASEIAELTELLLAPTTRLLTIVGAGGMGKTHLAIELARANQAHFADGAYFVALAPLATASEVPVAIGRALNLPLTQGDPIAALLLALRDKQVLLILDNFEHLLESPLPDEGQGADLVVRLLQAAPRLRIIVTSRERLNMHNEQRYSVGGLTYAPAEPGQDVTELAAVQLFVQSARRVQPHLQLDAADLSHVLQICRATLGMPLGLELAAAWVEVLPVGQIADEIARSGDFLSTDLRDVPERQRSMRAVFEWSWRLLRDDEQQLFQQLAVFRGGFTLAAAQAVAGATPATVLRLVAKSLIQVNAGRYEIHELLRQFAIAYLNQEEHTAVSERHSQFYLAFVAAHERPIYRDQPKHAVDELFGDIDNIRQAWHWAADHAHHAWLGQAACTLALFYRIAGAGAEWEHLFQRAIERLQAHLRHADTVELRRDLSMLMALTASACMLQSKHKQAADWARQAIELGMASGGVIGEVHGRLVMGQALRRMGQSDQARDLLEQTAALAARYQRDVFAEQLPDTEMSAYNWLCSIALSSDDDAAATRYIEQGMQICQRLNKTLGTMVMRTDMIDIAVASEDFAAARTHAEAALRQAHEVGFRHSEASIIQILSTLARLRGEYMLAQALGVQALNSFRAIGNLVDEATQCSDIAYLQVLLGQYASAQTWLDRAFQALHIADMPARETQHYHVRVAQLACAIGDNTRALAHALQAVQMAHQLDGTPAQSQALAVLGVIYTHLGQLEQAGKVYQQALACVGERRAPNLTALPHAGLAELALGRGDMVTALEHAEVLVAMLDTQARTGFDEPFRVLLACYRVLAAAGDPRATPLLSEAHALLVQYASDIPDEAQRASFVHVPNNRALAEAQDD